MKEAGAGPRARALTAGGGARSRQHPTFDGAVHAHAHVKYGPTCARCRRPRRQSRACPIVLRPGGGGVAVRVLTESTLLLIPVLSSRRSVCVDV